MIRLTLTRGPVLMSMLPFGDKNRFDKPVNAVINTLIEDEMGWDRVKKIFRQGEDGLTKELQSIISMTLSGTVIGALIGGMGATRNTVENFISSNEATKFLSAYDAKQHLQQSVFVNFIKKGGRWAGKLGLFCFMFSTITTCTTAYRGKLATENYILGGSVTGFLYKINLGFRAALVGAGLGGILGGISGSFSVLILYLSGVTMDEVLEARHKWMSSKDEALHKNIKAAVEAETEYAEIKKVYDENMQAKLMQQRKDVEDDNT